MRHGFACCASRAQTAKRRGQTRSRKQAGKIAIGQKNLAIPCAKDVFGQHCAVSKRCLVRAIGARVRRAMHVSKRPAELAGKVQKHAERDRALTALGLHEQLVQIAARHILGDHKQRIVDGPRIHQRHQRRVANLRPRFGGIQPARKLPGKGRLLQRPDGKLDNTQLARRRGRKVRLTRTTKRPQQGIRRQLWADAARRHKGSRQLALDAVAAIGALAPLGLVWGRDVLDRRFPIWLYARRRRQNATGVSPSAAAHKTEKWAA